MATVALEILSLRGYAVRDYRKLSRKSFCGISLNNVTLRWMSEMSANLCSLREFYDSGKSQKSQLPESRDYGGWFIFVMYFLARN
jgi:hypothetical protein